LGFKNLDFIEGFEKAFLRNFGLAVINTILLLGWIFAHAR